MQNEYEKYSFCVFLIKILIMKNLLLGISVLLLAFSCSKKDTVNTVESKIDSSKIIDSINQVRTKINDSISNKNRYTLLTGNYTLTHDMISGKGNVKFTKVEGNHDEYKVIGSLQSGKNYLKIDGSALRVSEKHFNFTGQITQSIQENDNGKVYTRSSTKTFMTKNNGKTWVLQDKPNPSGFIDKIEIKN